MTPSDTERLLLRDLHLDDVAPLVALDADPAVMRYISGGAPSTREKVETTVRRALGHRWVASDRATGDVVGWFSLRPTGDAERELGYRLRREAWGRGLATEGCRSLLDHAFDELAVERVWAHTMEAVNTASRRVMERCGLHHVRTFSDDWPDPIDGSEHGDVEYELLRRDRRS